jgi:hypothetical protein
MACLYNQNQGCSNMCCTGEDCLQHPQNRIKKFYKEMKSCIFSSADFFDDGVKYAYKMIIKSLEKAFPEVKDV